MIPQRESEELKTWFLTDRFQIEPLKIFEPLTGQRTLEEPFFIIVLVLLESISLVKLWFNLQKMVPKGIFKGIYFKKFQIKAFKY